MSHSPGAARPAPEAPPLELAARATIFGLLATGAVAAAIISGAWWGTLIALGGLAAAVAGIVVSVLALLDDGDAQSWRSSRSLALLLGAISIAAILAALTLP
jgi:hypothetical protein